MYNAQVFAPFVDVRKNDDGSRTVYGLVTSEAVDADNQIADKAWAREQMAGWSKWSNVRAMHKNDAVGVGVSVDDSGDDGIFLESKIVDSDAVMKIDAGVYKGYSIGIKGLPGNPYKLVKDAAAKNGRIVGGAIVEVSLVDRPAHPDALFSVVKNTEALDDEVSMLHKLAEAAGIVKSLTPDGVVSVESIESAESIEEAITEFLKAIATPQAATCSDCGASLETDGSHKVCATKAASTSTEGSHPKEDEVVDKAMVTEFIKGMTAEERAEVGLVSSEDFDALKTVVTEMGKVVAPTGVHLGSAIPTLPKSTELQALEIEKQEWEGLTKAANPQTAQLAQEHINRLNKAIEAATPAA